MIFSQNLLWKSFIFARYLLTEIPGNTWRFVEISLKIQKNPTDSMQNIPGDRQTFE